MIEKSTDPDFMTRTAHDSMLLLGSVPNTASKELQDEIRNVVLMVKSASILKKTGGGAQYRTAAHHALETAKNAVRMAVAGGYVTL